MKIFAILDEYNKSIIAREKIVCMNVNGIEQDWYERCLWFFLAKNHFQQFTIGIEVEKFVFKILTCVYSIFNIGFVAFKTDKISAFIEIDTWEIDFFGFFVWRILTVWEFFFFESPNECFCCKIIQTS